MFTEGYFSRRTLEAVGTLVILTQSSADKERVCLTVRASHMARMRTIIWTNIDLFCYIFVSLTDNMHTFLCRNIDKGDRHRI
jgi:hypothetical protein